jgi:hypothetical protein
MPRTRLRIIIPLLQVLLIILAFAADDLIGKLGWSLPGLRYACAVTLPTLVLKLNFPLVVLWLPIAYPMSVISYRSSGASSPTGVMLVVSDLAILTSAAAFWYFVVVEVEMRRRKASCLRFSGRFMERTKATVMILVGIGAAVYALWDGHRLVVLDQMNRHHLFWSGVVADALIGGIFLVGWAAALITIGVQDVVRGSESG